MQEKMKAMDEILVAQVNSCENWRRDKVYREEYEDMLLSWMAKGESFNAFAGFIGVPSSLVEQWIEEREGFKEAFEVGEALSLGYWEKLSKLQASGLIKGSAPMIQYIMNNRFGDKYKQKQEIGVSSDVVYQFDTGIKRVSQDEDLEDQEEKEGLL